MRIQQLDLNIKVPVYAYSINHVVNERDLISKKDKENHKLFRKARKEGKRNWL